jgi:hypothetical protein
MEYMEQIQVYVSGNYKENEDATFNYNNKATGKQYTNLSLNEAEEIVKQDIVKGLLISYPSELNLSKHS